MSGKQPPKKAGGEDAAKVKKKAAKKPKAKKDSKKGKTKAQKGKKTSSRAKKASAKDIKVKPELPVGIFSKPGQKYVTPPQGDATRAFYESLYKENPHSLIAIKYSVEYGLFGGNAHSKLLEKYKILQAGGHFKRATGAIDPQAVAALAKNDKKQKNAK